MDGWEDGWVGDTWGHGGDTHPEGSVPQPRAAPGARSGPTLSRLAVLIIPLVDKDSGAVVCVILVHCGQLSDSDEQNLRALERHTLVAYRRLQALQKLQPWPQVSLSTSSSQNSLAKPEKAPDSSYSDLDCKILQLCGELYDLDAASLQLKVINYLKQETQSLCCCLLLVSEDNHQLFCQVGLHPQASPCLPGRGGTGRGDPAGRCHPLPPTVSPPQAILSMLQDMNFINNYKMDRQTLTRFCLMVKKGYRDPPYHNWMHAFSVSHFCYLLYKNLELVNYLEDIEIFALFISCMCHDLDHRGTNNSFQVASKSVLAALYSSEGSVMEVRSPHPWIRPLGCRGWQGDYQRMLDLMRDIILATDLAHHLRIFKDLQKMAEVGYDPKNKQHRSLLLCLLMTSCDLSDQTKGWKTTRKIAELIYKEFFSQGDLEKAMGNRPLEMMDREKAYIPELQISFMEHIAMPIYKLLQDLFPKAAELYERVASNREQWTKVSHKFTIRGLPSNNSLDFLDEEYDPTHCRSFPTGIQV
uniref:Phosphodiesterase n=1 Tax=Buteo japonicus TaxID=224669 RepID=A0A8C0HNT7_9AVES